MYNEPRRPRRNTNIDGIFRPTAKPPQAHYLRPQPIAPKPEPVPKKSITPTPSSQPARPEVVSPIQPFRYNASYNPQSTKRATAASAPPRPLKPKKTRLKRIAARTTIAAVVIMLVIGGWLGSRILGNVDKVFHGSIVSDAQALTGTTTLKGESSGRVNILLAGDSADDPGHAGAQLTDSIMVISIDTVHHTGFMLSIPRDTWVDIPGIGHEKINAANIASDFSQSGYPNGGMGQLEQVITTNFGIPIDYYALINYSAFKDAVNAVGGITITINSSDPRGIYDAYTHLRLPNGPVTLTGQEALNLARARGDGSAGDISYGLANSDYDRTMHQRQMLVALEQKAASAGVLSNPLKIGQLFNAVGNNVTTDLNVADALRFIQLTKGMNPSNLQSLTLPISGTNPLLKDYLAPDGEEALIPAAGLDDFSQIQQYYQDLTSGKIIGSVVSENPSVVVLNASDVVGLARQEANKLQAEGFNVVGVTDANNEYPASTIVDMSKGQKPAALSALQKVFNSNTTTTTSTTTPPEAAEAQGYTADFVVVLGKNWDSTVVSPATTQ